MKIVLLMAVLLSPVTTFAQSDDQALLEKTNINISNYMKKRDFKSAALEAEKAIGISKAAFGEDARQVAIAYENLGVILSAREKHKHAVGPLKRALEIFNKDPVGNAPDIAGSMQKLGDALSRSGKSKEAEALFTSAVETAKQNSGESSKQFLSAKTASACFYLGERQFSKAYNEFIEGYAGALLNHGRNSVELDQVALSCGGGFVDDFWKNARHQNEARKRLDQLLGYELGKPTKIVNADYNIRWSDIGRTDAESSFAVVKVWIDQSGSPTDAKMIYGQKRFSGLATTAARESKFKPSIQDGNAIADVMYVYYSFIR